LPYYKYDDIVDMISDYSQLSESDVDPSGYNLSIQFKVNNGGDLGELFYWAIPYRLQSVTADQSKIITHSVSYIMGKQFNIGLPNLYVDLSLGLGLKFQENNNASFDPVNDFYFVIPLDISLGYTF